MASADREQMLTWLDAESANLIPLARDSVRLGLPDVAWAVTDARRGYFWPGRGRAEWLDLATSGVSAAPDHGDDRAHAAANLCLADAYGSSGRPREAAAAYVRARDFAVRADWTTAQAAALDNLAAVQADLGSSTQPARASLSRCH